MEFTIEELQTKDFDDKEFNELTSNNRLTKFMICKLFTYIGVTLTQQMLSKMSSVNWMEHYYWTYAQHDKCLKDYAKIYKNLYRYGDRTAIAYATHFLTLYGFNIRDSKQNEQKHYDNLLNYKL